MTAPTPPRDLSEASTSFWEAFQRVYDVLPPGDRRRDAEVLMTAAAVAFAAAGERARSLH